MLKFTKVTDDLTIVSNGSTHLIITKNDGYTFNLMCDCGFLIKSCLTYKEAKNLARKCLEAIV